MKLHLLGVNGPFPEPNAATSGYLVETEEALIALDFGTGILSRLTAKAAPESLSAVCLSHWHFDHTSDLLPLIYRLEAAGAVLPVYGPVDESSAIRAIVEKAACFALRDIAPGETFSVGDAEIQVGEARHPVPAVGFRVKAGGKTLGYTGDTNTLPGLKDFYRGCDLLLADGLFPAGSWSAEKPHLSAPLAAELTREAGAKRLVLTHLHPAFPRRPLLEEARAVFSAVELAEPGAILPV